MRIYIRKLERSSTLWMKTALLVLILSFTMPDVLSAAVARLGNWDTSTGGTTLNNYTVPAGSNRLLVFVTGFEIRDTTYIDEVTYGGIPLTPAVQESIGGSRKSHCEIYYLNEVGIQAATGDDFVVTYTGGDTPDRTTHAAAAFSDVDQTNPIYDTASNADESDPFQDPIEATVDVLTGGMSIAGAESGKDESYTWGNGWTETTDQTVGGTATMSTAEHAAVADGTDTASANWSTSDPNREVVVVVSLRKTDLFSHTITASAGTGGSISPSGSVSVTDGDDQTFTITVDSGYSIEDVLVDAISQGGITTYTFTNVTTDHSIAVTFTPPPEACYDISDTPLDARYTSAPANIMFVLDDSGSMDWEFITNESDGLFLGHEYVFNDPGDNVYTSGGNSDILSGDDRRRWKSQWSGYNKMYYTSGVTYTPWPTLSDADPDTPRSHPTHSSPTFNLGNTYTSIDSTDSGIIVDNEDSDFSKTGTWDYATPSAAWNDHHWYTPSDGNYTATWTPTTIAAGDYDVYVRWVAGEDRSTAVTYTINYAAGSSNYVVNQRLDGGQWNKLDTRTFNAGAGNVTLTHTRSGASEVASADAVKFVPTTTTSLDIARAHYYVWSYDENAPYLVNLDGTKTYYRVNDSDEDEIIDDGELEEVTSPPSDVQTNRTYAEERQNFANWYSFYRRRELTATAAISNVINNMEGVQIGFYSINGNLNQTVLKVNVGAEDNTSTLLNTLYGLTIDSDGTPLRRGLRAVGRYFHQDDSETGGIGDSPYASADDGGACQQSFAVVMTDGYYNGDSPSVGDVDGNNGAPYADDYSDTLADVAMYYYENDLSDELSDSLATNSADDVTHQHMVTYSVSFGVTGTLDLDNYDLSSGSTNYPTWPNPTSGNQQKIDDLWHAAVNGRGTFLSAGDPTELIDSMLTIMQNIELRLGSASSVTINGDELYGTVGDDILMFQTSYDSDGWAGDVKAYELDSDGEVITDPPVWSAADELENVSWDNRLIATYNGSAGIPFRFDSLTSNQKAQLDTGWETDSTNAQNILNYLRGDSTNEEQNSGSFRDRSQTLGDIVSSSALHESGVLYAGSNDGMLHAFDADDGTELFAYVPNLVFENLKDLSDPDYSHKFYVDLTPFARDMGSTTLLVGGLGKGGKGYYALDITDPLSIAGESSLASKVKWEYPNSSTPTSESDDLGFSYSRALIVKSNDTENAEWIVIFGNGYNSPNGHAVLFVLDPATGALLTKIDTEAGSCNGLSSLVPADVNYDGKVDYVYAGDLKGNLWKFDLTGSSYLNWEVAFYDGTTPKPLFQAKDASGLAQPITAKPDVMVHCEKHGYLVVFGTGKYLEMSGVTSTNTQTIYGIWDYGDDDDDSEYLGSFNRTSTPQLSNQEATVTLLQQTIVSSSETDTNFWTVNGEKYRIITANEPVWETEDDEDSTEENPKQSNPSSTENNHAGWYFDLPISGERVVSDVIIREGKVIAISFIPEDSPCGTGGDSVFHEMNACSGARLAEAQIDINEDGKVDSSDRINIGTEDDPIWVAPTGKQTEGRLQPPAILRVDDKEIKYLSSSEGGIETIKEKAVTLGISHWKEFE